MSAVNQGDPTGSNAGWPTTTTTNSANEVVTFNGYRGDNVDVTSIPSTWSKLTNNNSSAVSATAGSAGTWDLSGGSSEEQTPSTTLTVTSGG